MRRKVVLLTVSLAVILAVDFAGVMATAVPALAQYGPDTCVQGYVWREAFPDDHVCVPPASRDQAATDNSYADARKDPNGAYGPDSCIQGYVWRVARPSDLVCVTPDIRDQTAMENQLAAERRASSAPATPAPAAPAAPAPPAAPAAPPAPAAPSSSAGDKVFKRPRYRDDRLDWCFNWGTLCGKPAAVAFCHSRRFEDAAAFSAEVVGTSAQTRLIGSNQVCNGPKCTAFAAITCTRPIPGSRVFANPVWKGYRLDACLNWGTDCGMPAADAFCRAKGFTGALDAKLDAEAGYASTRLIGTDKICTGSGCTGFQQIICY
jgi:hypothetical protein